MSLYLHQLKQLENLSGAVIRKTKIHTVLKRIGSQDKIPNDSNLCIKQQAASILRKWHILLYPEKGALVTSTGEKDTDTTTENTSQPSDKSTNDHDDSPKDSKNGPVNASTEPPMIDLTTDCLGVSLSANLEDTQVISIDEDSDMELLSTTAPKENSLRRSQLPATPRNPGSGEGHEGSINYEVSSAPDTAGTVPWLIFIKYLTSFVDFYTIDTTEASSNPKSHAADFDNSSEIQTNDHFGIAEVNQSPIVSAGKHRSMNQRTPVAGKGTSPKPSRHKANQPKISPNEGRKRALTEAFEKDGELYSLYTRRLS